MITPEAIAGVERVIKTLSKILTYLSSEVISAMERANIFPTLNKEILPLLVINPNALVPQEVKLRSTNTHKDEIVTFSGSTMHGRGTDQTLEEILHPLIEIVTKLVENIKERFDNIISDPFLPQLFYYWTHLTRIRLQLKYTMQLRLWLSNSMIC